MAAPPVAALAVAMIEPAFGALLVAAVSAAALFPSGLLTAGDAAIALAAIAARA